MTSHYYDGADAGKPKLRVLELRIREDGWPAVAQRNSSSDRFSDNASVYGAFEDNP